MRPAGRAATAVPAEANQALTCCQDLDQLTQILKVTGVPGTEFVQKLNDKAVSGRWAQAGPGCPRLHARLTRGRWAALQG